MRKKTSNHTEGARSKKGDQSPPGTRASQAGPNPQELIWQVVSMIPGGRVASYGQIATLAGMPGKARLVGRTLRYLPTGSKLPWHRVINARREISFPPGSAGYVRQRSRLEAEGVEFVGERVVKTFLWDAG
ncbi:MAG: MGMT family protein [Pseudomonadales bacterium]|nr:MGMT family protein [Pseudomonadales bacterium]